MTDHPWGRADLMATAAVRYCLGRSSYIVGDCVDWLVANWQAFSPNCRALVARDLQEAIQRDDEARERGDQYLPLGMDMDRREWERAAAEIGRGMGGSNDGVQRRPQAVALQQPVGRLPPGTKGTANETDRG